MNNQWILLADDDSSITEALALLLERDGRTVIICSDLDSAQIALAHFPVTHLLSDVQFSGRFGYEGLHFLTRRGPSPLERVILMSGDANPELQRAALAAGASAVLQKPFDIETLEQLLGPFPAEASGDYDVIPFPSIEALLAGHDLHVAFQPIVRLGGNEVFAYEALARTSGRWAANGPVTLFEYASRRGCLAAMNVTMLRKALAAAHTLPSSAALFINLDPVAFEQPDLAANVIEAAEKGGIDPHRVVLEITERSAFTDEHAAARSFESLRSVGFRFALDDHGSAYSHLGLIEAIGPSFVKISQAFGTGMETDPAKRRIVHHIVGLSAEFGSETIIEGVETSETADEAVRLGVGLAQGFFFGRPQAA